MPKRKDKVEYIYQEKHTDFLATRDNNNRPVAEVQTHFHIDGICRETFYHFQHHYVPVKDECGECIMKIYMN